MIDDQVRNIMRTVDESTEPRRMSQEQAKDFLEQLVTELESRLDGIKDDLRSRDHG